MIHIKWNLFVLDSNTLNILTIRKQINLHKFKMLPTN